MVAGRYYHHPLQHGRGGRLVVEIDIDQPRLSDELEHLAGLSDAPAPAVTRVLYSDTDLAARAYLKGLLAGTGLRLREDALGNTFARWEGCEPGLPAVASGSHIDAVPHSGRFDGTVGVLGALEAIRALQAAGFSPGRPIELVLFTSEEPTRFGLGCIGSRAMAGAVTPPQLRRLEDEEGRNLDEVRRQAGFHGDLEDVRLPKGHYHAFVELHIEQGPLLEREGVSIGVVEAIAAPTTLHVKLRGEGGHAGTVLMSERRDALLAGTRIAQAVEEAARGTGSGNSVATVGIFDVHPRAANSIPSEVFLTVDARDTEPARRDTMVVAIRAAIAAEEARGVATEVEVINADPPVICDAEVIQAITAAAEEAGFRTRPLFSRAYHDALFMAQLCPSGMIFIPCRGGVSHRPDEYAEPEAIAAGVKVLARTLARLATT